MRPRASESHRKSGNIQGGGPNWILIAGGALLSTLSVRLGYKIKQVLDKQTNSSSQSSKVNGKTTCRNKSGSGNFHSNGFCCPREEDGYYNGYTGSENVEETKHYCNGQLMTEPEMALPLVTIPSNECISKENGVMWSHSPDRLEVPHKPFHHSNSSESPCVSESGSDIFSKREVIQKLRQQIKRRDDMILEMQDQIANLQGSIAAQLSHSSHLQSLLDAANGDLFSSEMEIQRLRKVIADQCAGHINSNDRSPNVPVCPRNRRNGTYAYANGYPEVENNMDCSDVAKRDGEKIEKLKKDIYELKELMEGKDYLLQNYKEQISELSLKIKELQLRLDSQLPNILCAD